MALLKDGKIFSELDLRIRLAVFDPGLLAPSNLFHPPYKLPRI